MSAPISPALGVLGGGQLGRMFVHAAQVHGFRVIVLEPDAASPAGAAAEIHLCADYTDPAALARLADACVAVTTEFENVPAAALRELAARRPVSPPAPAVEACQHRGREKGCFMAAGVPCAPHALITIAAETDNPSHAGLLPGILKTASLGYDGKGQTTVQALSDLPAAFAALGSVACVLEKRLPLRAEISVIVARNGAGQVVHLPVQQNLHRNGILAVTQVPAPDVDSATAAAALDYAERLSETLNYVGVLCVEFFILEDGSLVANEMAPRPHNSGHYTIDACVTSQFEQQARVLAGLPLGAVRQHSPAVMLNLLGDAWFARGGDAPIEPDWSTALRHPQAKLHLYGKSEARRGRKMGHVTVLGERIDDCVAQAAAIEAALGVAP